MRFLISGYTGLGNLILKTPFLKTLRQLYPQSIIDIITDRKYGTHQVLHEQEVIDQNLYLSREATALQKWKFFWNLRSKRYDVIFIPFDANPRFLSLGSYLAGVPVRVRHIFKDNLTMKGKWNYQKRTLLYPATQFVHYQSGRHEIDLNLDLLEAYQGNSIKRQYDTFIDYEEDESILHQFNLSPQDYILIQPGSANGRVNIKSWPTSKFQTLINNLLDAYQLPIVLVGDEGDQSLFINPLLQHFPNESRIINTAGQTSVNDLINLISHAQLTVCHDSSVMHIADALGKPQLALYGPTDHKRTSPLKETSHQLFSENKWTGILQDFRLTENELARSHSNKEFMGDLDVNTVLKKINQLLQE